MTTGHTTLQTPRTAALDRQVAMRLAADEYDRFAVMLTQLADDDWSAPTECTGWTVRDMAGHVLGMTQMVASVPEMLRQQVGSMRRHRRDGGLMIDALTALQVEKNQALSVTELVEEMRRAGPRAARGRRRTPALMRRRTLPDLQDVDGAQEAWTFGYLMDVILTRDPFMHRIDISRATGVPMVVTADHEGVIVDDVVREWAGRHGQPYALELTGPAGGRWQQGEGGEAITMDALDFCRALSGRVRREGLLAQQLPF